MEQKLISTLFFIIHFCLKPPTMNSIGFGIWKRLKSMFGMDWLMSGSVRYIFLRLNEHWVSLMFVPSTMLGVVNNSMKEHKLI